MSSIDDLAQKMAELQQRMMASEQSFDEERRRIKELRDEESDLLRQLQSKQAERASEERRISEARQELNALKDLLKDLQHEMTKAHVEEATRKRALETERDFERIIAGAKWREFLYDHQMFGAKFGANAKRWICGDTVGLGKTVQAVAWTDLIQAKKVLIITPKNLTQNFIDHIQEWSNGRQIIPIVGVPRDKRDLMLPIFRETMKEFVVVVNYEAWYQDRTILDLLLHMQFDTIICDEAHKLKDPRSATYIGVNKLTYLPNKCATCSHYEFIHRKNADGYHKSECTNCRSEFWSSDSDLLSVKHILLMTGTPIKNRPQEIFPLLNLVNRSAFGTEKEFLRLYCRQTDSGRWVWKPGGEDRLTSEIKPFFLKRRRSDTDIRIPPQKEIRHVVQLDEATYPEQFKAYKTLRELSQVVVDNTEEMQNRGLVANAMITYLLRLRQMISWPAGIRYLHPKTKEVLFQCEIRESVKIDKAEEITRDLVENGSRVLIFTRFTPPIDELYLRLTKAGLRVCILDGRTKVEDRKAIARNFDAKYVDEDGGPKWDVALCNYGVGSEGLTLTDATDTILLDAGWNPAEREQATGRTDRIGQKRETTVHQIYADVWIEHWQDELMRTKKAVTDGFETSVEFMQIARDGMLSDEF